MTANHPWVLLVSMNNRYDWSAQFHLAEARLALEGGYFCMKNVHVQYNCHL